MSRDERIFQAALAEYEALRAEILLFLSEVNQYQQMSLLIIGAAVTAIATISTTDKWEIVLAISLSSAVLMACLQYLVTSKHVSICQVASYISESLAGTINCPRGKRAWQWEPFKSLFNESLKLRNTPEAKEAAGRGSLLGSAVESLKANVLFVVPSILFLIASVTILITRMAHAPHQESRALFAVCTAVDIAIFALVQFHSTSWTPPALQVQRCIAGALWIKDVRAPVDKVDFGAVIDRLSLPRPKRESGA